ncbi:MAG: hypothetical protein LKE40_06790 [Spirochaetia bacterium]|jgi:S-adenosylmethionine hydrolase|nr:hypothetical protein [Spirochaetia bacterium]
MVDKNRLLTWLCIVATLLLAVSCSTAAAVDQKAEVPPVVCTGQITSIDKYGNVTLNIPTKAMLDQGVSFGDTLEVRFDNGFQFDALLLPEYSVKDGAYMVLGGAGSFPLYLSINHGDLADKASVRIGNSVSMTLLPTAITRKTANQTT